MPADECEIAGAENGFQGVEVLQRQGAGISPVLPDGVMPEMDGFGLLEAMGRNHWLEGSPVIVISAEADNSAVRRACAPGAAGIAFRPFNQLISRRTANVI